MKNPTYRTLLFIVYLTCAYCGIFSYAQNTNYGPLSCTMMTYEKEVKAGEAITNVLVVKNQNGIPREFYLEVSSPDDWIVLLSSERTFFLEPDDSIFIPIRMVPNISGMKGGTKYNITVFVIGTDGRNHATCNFLVSKPRVTSWDMKVLPRSRIYFLNNEYEVDLGIQLNNRGEDKQDINLSWRILGQGLSLYTDSLRKKQFLDLSLETDSDTVINFKADLSKPQRNMRRIDFEGYNPQLLSDARKYTIYFSAVEPKSIQSRTSKSVSANLSKLASSVDFIKLSDTYTVNSHGSSVIPVTWFSNFFNVLGVQPIWMNNFQVAAPMRENSMLRANFQHVFTFYTPSQSTLRNLNGNLSYNSTKLDFILGQGVRMRNPLLNGLQSVLRPGAGIAVTYRPINGLFVAGSVSQSPRIFTENPQARNYEASVGSNLWNRRLETSVGFSRTDLPQQTTSVNSYLGGFRFRLNQNHRILAAAGLNQVNTILVDSDADFNANWRLTYSGLFLNKRLNQTVSYFRRNIVALNGGFLNQNDFIRSMTRLNLKKSRSSFMLSSAYNRLIINTALGETQSISVPINFSFSVPTGRKFNVFPSLFYNYFETPLGRMQFRGLNFGSAYFDIEKYVRANFNINAGYNRYSDNSVESYPELFSARAFLGLQYRTITFNGLYNYGPLGLNAVRNFHLIGARYPQYIFSNLTYQYVFKATNFVGELALNHSWNNQTYSNNFSISPQLYYYTNNGWRFNLQFFYNVNSRNNERAIEFYQFQGFQLAQPEERITFASNFNINFGIRKTFGIPVPQRFRKVNYVDAQFRAFLDFNGNKIMDNDEVPLENLVIQVNGHEVITDKSGAGVFRNIPEGTYEHRITPLIDLDGWFTYQKDSIKIKGGEYNIPFTRGVLVQGNIVMDREKFTKDVLGDLDLSGIRIFTTDTLGQTVATITDRKGFFQFYVPYGSYVLSMDEEVLSDRFYIAQNHIPVDLVSGMDSYFQSFFIIEKRRMVKKKRFDADGNLITTEEPAESKFTDKKTLNEDEPASLEGTIFKNNRKSSPNDTLNKVNRYNELDMRIQRMDDIINNLLQERESSRTVDPKVLAQALRQFKNEELALSKANTKMDPIKFNANRPFQLIAGEFDKQEEAMTFIQSMESRGYRGFDIIGVYQGKILVRVRDFSSEETAREVMRSMSSLNLNMRIHKW